MNTITQHHSSTPLLAPSASPLITHPSARHNRLQVLFQGVMECLIDGVVIVTNTGDVQHINRYGEQICNRLMSDHHSEHHTGSDLNPPSHGITSVPRSIWRSCEALIDSRELFPDQPIVIEDEIKSTTGVIRVRVRWLDTDYLERAYLLVTLEDQSQTAHYRATAESRRYSLTEREATVWRLRRTGYTYKAIAAELYIAEDTVKKHLKSIHAKRNSVQEESTTALHAP